MRVFHCIFRSVWIYCLYIRRLCICATILQTMFWVTANIRGGVYRRLPMTSCTSSSLRWACTPKYTLEISSLVSTPFVIGPLPVLFVLVFSAFVKNDLSHYISIIPNSQKDSFCFKNLGTPGRSKTQPIMKNSQPISTNSQATNTFNTKALQYLACPLSKKPLRYNIQCIINLNPFSPSFQPWSSTFPLMRTKFQCDMYFRGIKTSHFYSHAKIHRYDATTNELICDELGVAYTIVNGVANLNPSDARLIKNHQSMENPDLKPK